MYIVHIYIYTHTYVYIKHLVWRSLAAVSRAPPGSPCRRSCLGLRRMRHRAYAQCYIYIYIYIYTHTLFTLLDARVSSLSGGHANLLCIVPSLTDDPRREFYMHVRVDYRAYIHVRVYYVSACSMHVTRALLLRKDIRLDLDLDSYPDFDLDACLMSMFDIMFTNSYG